MDGYFGKAGVPAVNEWDAYISLKLQGPAYVRGSRQPNRAWMDRVLLVRSQEQDQADRGIPQGKSTRVRKVIGNESDS